jgi:hypothetical protein
MLPRFVEGATSSGHWRAGAFVRATLWLLVWSRFPSRQAIPLGSKTL